MDLGKNLFHFLNSKWNLLLTLPISFTNANPKNPFTMVQKLSVSHSFRFFFPYKVYARNRNNLIKLSIFYIWIRMLSFIILSTTSIQLSKLTIENIILFSMNGPFYDLWFSELVLSDITIFVKVKNGCFSYW